MFSADSRLKTQQIPRSVGNIWKSHSQGTSKPFHKHFLSMEFLFNAAINSIAIKAQAILPESNSAVKNCLLFSLSQNSSSNVCYLFNKLFFNGKVQSVPNSSGTLRIKLREYYNNHETFIVQIWK